MLTIYDGLSDDLTEWLKSRDNYGNDVDTYNDEEDRVMKPLYVLVACESSGIVRRAFEAKGHDVLSCDLLPADDGSPYHYQGPVEDLLQQGGKFDLMIAHPPCTFLCSSGLHWNKRREGRAEKTATALNFVRMLMDADIPKIAIENPCGCIGTKIRKADQYIQPYQFGEDASKKTGLWLKDLPLLYPTTYCKPRLICKTCKNINDYDAAFSAGCRWCGAESGLLVPRWSNQTDSGQNKLPPSTDRWKLRAETYQGIANAMADQWG